jgi:hypothetical protein
MFYCDECRETLGLPESYFRSRGPCEVCGHVRECNEVPSSQMPRPRGKINHDKDIQNYGDRNG